MIHIVRATDLWKCPKLAETMFKDRKMQFCDRLGWPLETERGGLERDEYDAENPVYVISEDENGDHAGSMRLLPMIGKTMLSDYFSEAMNESNLNYLRTWECTRFCIAPGAGSNTASALLATGARLMSEVGLQRLVAVFDKKMVRLYRRTGASPKVIGGFDYKGIEILSGTWEYDAGSFSDICRRSNLDLVQLELAVANFDTPWPVEEKPQLSLRT